MPPTVDILVLGATGFTGRLVAKHLNSHRDRSSFKFALSARSGSKLAALASELDLNAQIPLITVDVTNADDLEAAVKGAKVVINTVGPYWKLGTPVVASCIRNHVHYVDLAGEVPWIRDIISQFDYAASKTHTVVVPSCGMDCVPSDLCVHLSVRTLKEYLGPTAEATRSMTAFEHKGGLSGGTFSTAYTSFTEIPRSKALAALKDHSLSPVAGAPSPRSRLVYTLPHVKPRISGGTMLTVDVDRATVLRTRGLLEGNPSMQHATYGPKFNYDELMVTRNWLTSVCLSLGIYSVFIALTHCRIARWAFKRFIVDRFQGSGPSDEDMERGYLKATNVTSAVSKSGATEAHAETVLRVRGDPGYLCTTLMLIECALALLDTSKLTVFARDGGVLTPATAFGDEVIKRLEATDRFSFESSIIKQ